MLKNIEFNNYELNPNSYFNSKKITPPWWKREECFFWFKMNMSISAAAKIPTKTSNRVFIVCIWFGMTSFLWVNTHKYRQREKKESHWMRIFYFCLFMRFIAVPVHYIEYWDAYVDTNLRTQRDRNWIRCELQRRFFISTPNAWV